MEKDALEMGVMEFIVQEMDVLVLHAKHHKEMGIPGVMAPILALKMVSL